MGGPYASARSGGNSPVLLLSDQEWLGGVRSFGDEAITRCLVMLAPSSNVVRKTKEQCPNRRSRCKDAWIVNCMYLSVGPHQRGRVSKKRHERIGGFEVAVKNISDLRLSHFERTTDCVLSICQVVPEKTGAYLHHDLPIATLVSWAEVPYWQLGFPQGGQCSRSHCGCVHREPAVELPHS